MQTRSIVTMVKQQNPIWGEQPIVDLYNQLHWMIMAKPLQQTLYVDTSTGRDYKFTSVSGTYSYDVSTAGTPAFPVDGYKVLKVYTGDYDDQTEVDVQCYDAVYDGTASIVFPSNPGATDYYVKFIKKPTQITSKTIEGKIPEIWHFEVVQGLLGMIELAESGQSNRWLDFKNNTIPLIQADLNKALNYTISASKQIEYKGY